jgi:kinesin family protein 2/24
VAKKIEMNLALAECNDNNAITRDASTPSSNGKVGATTSIERELALNQKDPSRRRQSLAHHSIDQNSKDKIDTRANLDKRAAWLRFSQAFVENLNYHLSREANEYTTGEADLEEDFEVEDIYETPKVLRCGKVAVFVRKRPIFPYEKSRKDFDVVAMSSSSCSGDGDKVTIHNCFMHSDMQQLKIKSWTYPCTMAFDEYSSNKRIYKVVADPLVRSVAFNGGCATIMMYGQTGSGKSYTMSAIEKGVCDQLFYFLSMAVGSSSSNNSRVVIVRFVELAGKSCHDSLASVGKDPTAKIVDNDDGSVQIMNATQKVCKTTDDLLNLIERGKTRRATEATEINAVSSRSHAVCQVEVFLSDHWKRKDYSKRGILNLIDCAGTERRNDSLYHDVSRQKETQEINASLYALKECIRARAKSSFKSPYVPYRASNLTRLLRESLENEDSKLCVIATIAPNATDTEHTMETLKTVSSIAGNEAQIYSDEPRTFYPNHKKSKMLVSPKEMNHSQLINWFKSQKFSVEFIPEHVDGKSIMRLTAKQIGAQFLYDDQTSLDLYNKLRNENDRVGRIQLEHRKLMKESSKK